MCVTGEWLVLIGFVVLALIVFLLTAK